MAISSFKESLECAVVLVVAPSGLYRRKILLTNMQICAVNLQTKQQGRQTPAYPVNPPHPPWTMNTFNIELRFLTLYPFCRWSLYSASFCSILMFSSPAIHGSISTLSTQHAPKRAARNCYEASSALKFILLGSSKQGLY